MGIGVSCGYVPMLAVVGAWFEKRRAAAIGIAVTGIGFGTLLMAPLAANLISKYGWRQTYVIFGILSVVILVLCGFITPRPPAIPGQESKKSIRELIRMAGIDEVLAASLMGIIGAASIAGRLGFGTLGVKLRSIRLFQLTFMLVAVSFIFWMLAGNSYLMLLTFAILLGTGYGGFIALSPTVAAELFGLASLAFLFLIPIERIMTRQIDSGT